MKNKSAFTLVELLVSISLTIILMLSITMFVTDWVKNIVTQEAIVSNNSDFTDFKYTFLDNLSSTNKYLTWFTNSTWALFRADKNFSKWWFTYIWSQYFTWIYCSWTDNDSTNHFIVKSFVPFESTNTDLFSWYNYDDWTYKTSFFSWTISNWTNIFTWTYFWPTALAFWNWSDMYVSDSIDHTILKFDKNNTSTLPQIVVWKSGIYWNDLTTLNTPTWLAFWDNTLFIADTLNDRIVYLSGWLMYELLNRDDWLREPTGLYYDSVSKTLYISNSAAWEILSYSSQNISPNPQLNINFNPNITVNSLNNIDLKFYSQSNLSTPINITSASVSDFVFNWINKWASDSVSIWSVLSYSFSGTTNNILSWNTYWLTLNNISWNFTSNWNYFVNMTLSWTTNWSANFPYFTQGDNDITTKWDNILKTITWWLLYPTWIKFDWTNLVVSDFLDRKLKTIDLAWNLLSSSALKIFDFNSLAYNKYSDYILKTPIKSLDLSFSNNLVSGLLNYYKNYSCNNRNENINRTYLFKKFYK